VDHEMTRRQVLGMGAAVAGGLVLGSKVAAAAEKAAEKTATKTAEKAAKPTRRVVVWSEGTAPKEVYPNDIRGAIAEGLKSLDGWEVVTATLADPDQGVSEASLKTTDVLFWWGHKNHDNVKDETVQRIVRRVKEEGMGFVSLHSAHFAKPYKALMGTACSWKAYVADGSACKVIVKDAKHPITKGVKDFTLEHTERFSEPYAVPVPEAAPLDGLYTLPNKTTESARMGFCWTIGKGKVFYFQPGHETYPCFFDENVRLIMRNVCLWAAPAK
jgi:trehalose utilization protein